MRARRQIGWLFLAGFLWPFLASAQTTNSKYVVSVRDLTVPAKALHHYQQGAALVAKRDPKDVAQSLPHFQKAIAEFAGYYEAYYEIGVADLSLSRAADAEQAFRTSIDLSAGRCVQSLLALGAVLVSQNKFAEAEGFVRRGLEIDSDSWTGHYTLGWIMFGLDRLEEAERNVRQALSEKADSMESLRLLIDIHSRQKNDLAVIQDVEDYLKLDPNSDVSARARSIRDAAQRNLAASSGNIVLVQPQLNSFDNAPSDRLR